MNEQSNSAAMHVEQWEREFNEVVRICGRKLETLEETGKKAKALQIDIGRLLIELRDRVKSGEIGELATWWEWFEDNRMQFRNIERRTAQWYMQIAGDANPEAKLEEMRAADAARQRNARAGRPARNQSIESK